MKISMLKYPHRISISKQSILNFVGAHPRLITIVTGLGIAVVFSTVGRFFFHDALATSVAASSLSHDPASATTTFQVDYVDNTPISKVPGHITNVFFPTQCQGCGASEFAPGHEAISPGDAQNFAPGQEAKSPGDAQNIAPGHQLKK